MARLQTEVDDQRSAQSSVTLGYTLGEWLETLEVEDSTRYGYTGWSASTGALRSHQRSGGSRPKYPGNTNHSSFELVRRRHR